MNGLLGRHSFTIDRYGDWSLDGRCFYLDLRDIGHLLTEDRLKKLSFDDIGFKGKHFTSLRGPTCLCCDGARYHAAQTKFPCIVVEDMVNPYGCKYRMIDGKHRLEKMINAGETSALFYVLQVSDLP